VPIVPFRTADELDPEYKYAIMMYLSATTLVLSGSESSIQNNCCHIALVGIMVLPVIERLYSCSRIFLDAGFGNGGIESAFLSGVMLG